MSDFNPFALSNILVAATYAPLTAIFLYYGKSKLTKIYAMHLLAVTIWGIGGYLIAACQNQQWVLELWKFAYLGVLFIPVFLQHAVLVLSNKKYPVYLALVYGQAFYFTYETLNGTLFQSVFLLQNSFYFHGGKSLYMVSFILWTVIVSVAHLQLFMYYRKSTPEEKKQIFFLLIVLIGFIGGTHNFLPAFFDTYPYGNFLISVPPLFLAYAIFKHRLLEVEVVIKKSLAYTILIMLTSLAYLSAIYMLENYTQQVMGYQSFVLKMSIAFTLGLAFFPLRRRIQDIVDRLIFKGTTSEIAHENALLMEEVTDKDKFKAVATLASGIAHEIKNPLTAIKTFSEYLPQKLNDKQFLTSFSRIVGEEVNRINDLVHQLMDFGKPIPLNKKETRIHKLIENTLDIFSNDFIDKNIKVHKDFYPDKALTIFLDPNQLKQAFINIIINAIGAMPNGGEIIVKTIVADHNIIIQFKDTGTGINKSDLKQIFNPFFSKKDMGTGLGLPITQSIIDNHGGTIRVNSQTGVGTEMIISLPIM